MVAMNKDNKRPLEAMYDSINPFDRDVAIELARSINAECKSFVAASAIVKSIGNAIEKMQDEGQSQTVLSKDDVFGGDVAYQSSLLAVIVLRAVADEIVLVVKEHKAEQAKGEAN